MAAIACCFSAFDREDGWDNALLVLLLILVALRDRRSSARSQLEGARFKRFSS
jgi:hypothetical protein